MFGELLRIGDEVTITIPQENRDWGYDPCPDSSLATVVGYGEIEYGRIRNFGLRPGFYENRSWTRLRLADGHEYLELTDRLELVDQAEHERRLADRRTFPKTGLLESKVFLRDLPETPFWEGDMVRASLSGSRQLVIVRISYRDLTSVCSDGSPYPAYHVSDKLTSSWDMAVSADALELIERGNVWKLAHGETLVFADLREEATFYRLLGHTDEVRNPRNGLYSWSVDEVLRAIKDGTVDAFASEAGLFGTPSRVSAIKFRDAGLGRRVAAMALEGFSAMSQ